VPFGKEGVESDLILFVSEKGKENGLAGNGVERRWGERSGVPVLGTEGGDKGRQNWLGTLWEATIKWC
jgi:hypothetical protein